MNCHDSDPSRYSCSECNPHDERFLYYEQGGYRKPKTDLVLPSIRRMHERWRVLRMYEDFIRGYKHR